MEKITYEIPEEGKIREVGSLDNNDYVAKIKMNINENTHDINQIDFNNNYRQNIQTNETFGSTDKKQYLNWILKEKLDASVLDNLFNYFQLTNNSPEYINLIKEIHNLIITNKINFKDANELIYQIIMFNKTDVLLNSIKNKKKATFEKKYDYIYLIYGTGNIKETIPQFIIDLIKQGKKVFMMVFGAFESGSPASNRVPEIITNKYPIWDFLIANELLTKNNKIEYNDDEIIIDSNRKSILNRPASSYDFYIYITRYHIPLYDYGDIINKLKMTNTNVKKPYEMDFLTNKTDFEEIHTILQEPLIKIEDLNKYDDEKTITYKASLLINYSGLITKHLIYKLIKKYLDEVYFKTLNLIKNDTGKKIIQVGIFPYMNEIILAQNFDFFDYLIGNYHNNLHLYLKKDSNLYLYKKFVFFNSFLIYNTFKNLLMDFDETQFIKVNNLLEINNLIIQFDEYFSTLITDNDKLLLIKNKTNQYEKHLELVRNCTVDESFNSKYLKYNSSENLNPSSKTYFKNKYLKYKSKYLKIKKLLNQ
jgi:hypothetical protein